VSVTDQKKLAEADRLYDRYARHLENEHWGKYVAIAKDGRVVMGETAVAVAQEAIDRFGRGSFLFKVGDRVMGRR
jgi:hypothetical protein